MKVSQYIKLLNKLPKYATSAHEITHATRSSFKQPISASRRRGEGVTTIIDLTQLFKGLWDIAKFWSISLAFLWNTYEDGMILIYKVNQEQLTVSYNLNLRREIFINWQYPDGEMKGEKEKKQERESTLLAEEGECECLLKLSFSNMLSQLLIFRVSEDYSSEF